MKVGYIVNGTHPLLQTISLKNVHLIDEHSQLLIVGMEEAMSFDPKTPLFDSTFSQQIGYCFSLNEGKENYETTLKNFVSHCVASRIKEYDFIFISDLAEIKYTKEVFKFETSIGIYIVNQDKQIYYTNKQFLQYFDLDNQLIIPSNVFVWQWEDSFSALLKTNNEFIESFQILNLLAPHCEVDKFFPAFCMEWRFNLLKDENYKVWERAYEVENFLSNLKVRLDIPLLEELSEENSILRAVLDKVEGDYIIQHYKGTDKTTGRIFPSGDGFSLQTFPHELRNLVIADKDCMLIEFDYQHFEYTLLSQLIGLNLSGDPHLELANLLFKDPAKRPIAKIVNYGLLYGKSLNTMIIELINEHKVEYSKEELLNLLKPITNPIQLLNEQLQKEFDEKGYITNIFGRKIFPKKRHACLNNYIQSIAADYMIKKISLIIQLLSSSLTNRVVLQNHDSVLINLSIKDIEDTDIASDILNILEGEEYNLKTKVDIKYGFNWAFTS